MNRMWEIREGYGSHSIEDKAYDCGFEDGYKKAIEEMEHHTSYGERRGGMMRRY